MIKYGRRDHQTAKFGGWGGARRGGVGSLSSGGASRDKVQIQSGCSHSHGIVWLNRLFDIKIVIHGIDL